MGRYTESIKNEALREKYARHSKDDDLTDMKDDVALLRAMCEMVVEMAFPEGESGKTLLEEWPAERVMQITTLVRETQKTIKAINEHQIKSQFMVHVGDVKNVMDKVVEILTRHIDDPETLKAIAAELTAIPTPGPGDSP